MSGIRHDFPPRSFEDLGPQQRNVAKLLAEGWTDKTIAATLNISQVTVRKHIHRLQRRLGEPGKDGRVMIVRWVLARVA
jgi:DNA-binding NarL/FixJ family response regulator